MKQLIQQVQENVIRAKNLYQEFRLYDFASYSINYLTPKDTFEKEEHLAYGLKARNRLDLYRTKNPKKQKPLIVFVHAMKKGELHENELKWIQKIESLLTPSYFSKHFCLVLTHREDDLNDEKKELSSIQETITKQLKSYCQLIAIPMFCISNSLFEKGMKNKKEVLKKASQVAELKAFIDEKLKNI